MDGRDAELNISLEDLLRIALGTDSLSGVNTIVLHSLLDLLLKKLDCENEKISISGYDAKVIEELLQSSTISPLKFNTDKMSTITEFNCLAQLETTVERLEQKLKFHLEKLFSRISLAVIRSSLHSLVYIHQFCESICSGSDPDMEKACKLTADEFFNERILCQTMPPIVKRFQAMANKLELFEVEFVNWLEGMENHLAKISKTEKTLEQIGIVDVALDKYHNTFMTAMEEVQDIVNTKIDRFEMIHLRNAIGKRIVNIKNKLSALKVKMKQARTVAVIFDTNTRNAAKQKPKKVKSSQIKSQKCGCEGVYRQISLEKPLALRLQNIQTAEQCDSIGTRRTSGLSISLG